MDKMQLPQRKSTRLKYFDYGTTGAYFITICTENRRKILSKIVGDVFDVSQFARDSANDKIKPVGDGVLDVPQLIHNNANGIIKPVGDGVLDVPQNVELLSCGIIADKFINQIDDFYDDITVDQYVIMPNHIHMILIVSENGSSGTPTPTRQNSTVSHFVSTFKRFCNKDCGQNIWQRGFYDHVIRNRDDYEKIKKYIYENPMCWYYDELYTEK